MQTKTKLKLGVDKGLITTVMVVCGAVVIVSFGLNIFGGFLSMAGADFTNQQVIDYVNSLKWNYIFGPDKCSQQDFSKLGMAINSGYDVKVLLPNRHALNQECLLTTASVEGIECWLESENRGTIGEPSFLFESFKVVSFTANELCYPTIDETSLRISEKGNLLDTSYSNEPVKWYIKR